MDRPVVVMVSNVEVGAALARDFRWPVVGDSGHAVALVEQGFSCIVTCAVDALPDCETIAVDGDLDVGGAHQLIAAMSHIDPLRLNADVGTFAWVTDDGGRVLLVRQAYGYGVWGLPGGTLGLGEPPDQAVVREVREESGYDVAVDRVVALYGRRQHIGVYFACSVVGGEMRTDSDTEVAEVGWFPPDDLPAKTSPVISLLRSDLASGEVPARFF